MPARPNGNPMVLGSIELDPKAIAMTGEVASSWVQVAKVGRNFKKGQKTFNITEADLEQIVENSSKVETEIPLDYDHLSLGVREPGQGMAAGWFKGFEIRDKALFGNAEWTTAAAEKIRNKEYRYISPVILWGATDEKGDEIGTSLLSAAITNYPFLKNMAPIALSELQDSGVVLADFSIDELGARLQEAVTAKFGRGWEYAQIADVFPQDNYLVYRLGGKRYRVDYTIDDKGVVSFTSESQEAIVQYEVLSTQPSGEQIMPQPTNVPIVPATPVALKDDPEFLALSGLVQDLKGSVVALTSENTSLKQRADAAELALKTSKATVAVDVLIASAKIKAEDKDEWIALHMENEGRFVKLSAGLQPRVKLNHQHGSNENDAEIGGTDGLAENGEAAIKMMEDAVAKYIADNGGPEKVKHGEAIRAVTTANPKLADRYREAFAATTSVMH